MPGSPPLGTDGPPPGSIATLAHPRAAAFWLSVALIGAGTGLSAIVLTRLLDAVQALAWPAAPGILEAAARGSVIRHLVVLSAAGLATALGQLLLGRLTSANGIETTTAIWFTGGRMPPVRTMGSAVLSVLVVGMGPLSAAVLMMELTGQGRGLALPVLIAVGTATLIARTIDIRSVYDARLSPERLLERQRNRA